MIQYASAWIATAIVFGIADAIWLTWANGRVYRPMIGEIMADKVSLTPAVVFYLIYVTGLVFFAVAPGIERESPLRALLLGGALGLVAYAAYDLSNQATLKVWDVRLTMIDMAWGTFASALAAGVACWAVLRFT